MRTRLDVPAFKPTLPRLFTVACLAVAAPQLGCGGDSPASDTADASDHSSRARASSSSSDAGASGSATSAAVHVSNAGSKLGDAGTSHPSAGQTSVDSGVRSGASCTPTDPCPDLLTCEKAHCTSELQRCFGAGVWSGELTGGACADFGNCQRQCACEGAVGSSEYTSCFISKCATTINQACQDCLTPYNACQQSSCKTELDRCSTTTSSGSLGDGGNWWEGLLDGSIPGLSEAGTSTGHDAGSGTSHDAGTGSTDAGASTSNDAGTPPTHDAGTAPPSSGVCAPQSGDDACDTCLKAQCCESFSACVNDSWCPDLATCLGDCQDQACIDDCSTAYQSGVDVYNTYIDCADTACASACGG